MITREINEIMNNPIISVKDILNSSLSKKRISRDRSFYALIDFSLVKLDDSRCEIDNFEVSFNDFFSLTGVDIEEKKNQRRLIKYLLSFYLSNEGSMNWSIFDFVSISGNTIFISFSHSFVDLFKNNNY